MVLELAVGNLNKLSSAVPVLRQERVVPQQSALPKIIRHLKRRDLQIAPPRDLVAKAMQLLMMIPAQRHGKFVTDFASKGSWLRKSQVMRIAGRALADETGLRRDEGEMGLVAPYGKDGFGRRSVLPCAGRPIVSGLATAR
jgi:hypothetical protein